MLPSMPILFTRDSQDAFGNKIEPSTSFFNERKIINNVIPTKLEKPLASQVKQNEPIQANVKTTQNEVDSKPNKNETSTEAVENTYENALVSSYFTKVQSRFGTNYSSNNKFIQFQELLKRFNPIKETPTALYRNIEKLFGPENSDLVEEFILFLTPGQAAEIGRFMDHFMMTKMMKFLELLQSTFSRKPAMLRKIMRAITNSMNSDSLDEMRSKVLPHLRSSPRLTLMFKSLFPDNVLPDSVYESKTDVLNDNFLTEDKGYDTWDFEEPTENRRNICAKEGIDTTYLQGRVFLQHGKMLKPSKVTYPYSKEPYRVHVRRLAPTQCRLSPPQSDEEKSSPKRNTNKSPKAIAKRTKKQAKSPCVRNIMKDVNDNNKHNAKDKTSELIKETNAADSHKTPKGRSHSIATNTKVQDTVDKKDTKTNKTKDKPETNKHSTESPVKKRDNKHIDKNCNKNSEPTKPKKVKIETTKVKQETISSQLKVENNSWTRDEDKTMLQVLQGEAGSEQIFGRIGELLPHRSMTEIRERFLHVMNLLQQMSLGEVT